MLKYVSFRVAAFIVRRLPLGAAYLLATVLARMAYRGRRRLAANVRDNVRHVSAPGTSDRDIEASVRDVFGNVAKYYVDLLRSAGFDSATIDRERLIDRGYHHLAAAHARGRGVVIVSAHIGNPELAIQAMVHRGLPVLVLTEPLEPPALSRFIDEGRSAAGHRFLPATYDNLKEAFRTLRAGGAIAVMFDRDIQGRSIVIDVCGAPMRVPTGAFDLAHRTGAEVVPVFTRRRVDNRTDAVIEPPIEMPRTGDRDADVRAGVTAAFARLEPYLRAEPGQWLVLERLWDIDKTRDPSGDGLY